MKKGWMILAAVVVVVVLLIGWYINGLNRVVRMNETVKESWAQIDNQLQRRSDLIPNLVSTVKGYAKHEKAVFENIAEARSKLAGAKTVSEKMDAAKGFEGALSRLLMVVENYPTLKANESFNKLMDELSGTENRIAVARMRYNQDVKEFNYYIKSVFGSIFARKRNLTEPKPYFEVEEKAKETPKVEF